MHIRTVQLLMHSDFAVYDTLAQNIPEHMHLANGAECIYNHDKVVIAFAKGFIDVHEFLPAAR